MQELEWNELIDGESEINAEDINKLAEYAKELNTNKPDADDMTILLSEKVDTEDGKGLSTNDFTNAFKAMLENVDSEISPWSTNIPTSEAVYNLFANLQSQLPTLDSEFSEISENPVQNKVITAAFTGLGGELHTLIDNALTKDNLTLENKDDENLTIETTNITPMWLPTEQHPDGAPFKILFKDTKARGQIANIPMQKIFEVTTEEDVGSIVIDRDADGNLFNLDEVYLYIKMPSALTETADWSCYVNDGVDGSKCLYYFAANKTGKNFVAKTERMCNGMWFTQKFSNLTNTVYNNNYTSSYIMGEVDYITSLSINCEGLPIGSTVVVCSRKVVE